MPPLVIRSARPVPLPGLFSPVGLARNLWAHRDLLRQFTLRFFLARHRGTHLGIIWALAFPLLMLAVYTFVFNFIFQARLGIDPGETRSQYAVLLFCGTTVYAIFAETVIRSCGVVLDNPNYATKVVFPLEVLPLACLLSALMFSVFGLALVVIGAAVFFPGVPWTIVLLPLVLLPLIALALGLGWFVAAFAVFVRDAGNLVTIIVSQLLFFLTPIFYSIESLPPAWRPLANANPLAHVVEGARRVMVYGTQPDWPALAAALAVGLLAMQLGYAFFIKCKRGFADVL